MTKLTSNILDKILWRGKNKWLLLGAALGTFIGLFLLLASLQFFFDVKKLLQGDANPGDQYVQINKKVNLFNSLGVKSGFSEDDIRELNSQKFIEEVGQFTANDFKVGASSDMLGFYTELFFEAVPNDFLDVRETDFRWSEGQNTIPILVSKDYLALYNFGFAPSQGLPQLTPSTIGKLNMEITISGNGKKQSFNGRIVGFSDRINSILVPPTFMEWANKDFGSNPSQASRLIIKVKNPLAKEFQAFLKEKGYEVSAGRLIGSQFGVLLKVVLSVLWGMGLLILALSMLIFTLNFQLLIAQSRPEIQLLLETGHYPSQISGILVKRFSILFLGIVFIVMAALLSLRIGQVNYLLSQGFELKKSLDKLVWLIGSGFYCGLLFINILNIRRAVRQLA